MIVNIPKKIYLAAPKMMLSDNEKNKILQNVMYRS
jgi:hypothetical protein